MESLWPLRPDALEFGVELLLNAAAVEDTGEEVAFRLVFDEGEELAAEHEQEGQADEEGEGDAEEHGDGLQNISLLRMLAGRRRRAGRRRGSTRRWRKPAMRKAKIFRKILSAAWRKISSAMRPRTRKKLMAMT